MGAVPSQTFLPLYCSVSLDWALVAVLGTDMPHVSAQLVLAAQKLV